VEAPNLPSASRSVHSAHADATHTCTLELNGTYPQIIHKMWGLFSTRGQDVAYLDPWSKLYERCSVSTGHHDTQNPAQWEDADQDLKSWRVCYTGTENLAAFRILIHHHKMRPRPHGPEALRRPPRSSKRRSMQHPVYGLPRTRLPRGWMNNGMGEVIRFLSALGLRVAFRYKSQPRCSTTILAASVLLRTPSNL
jgi:hypothetical protein